MDQPEVKRTEIHGHWVRFVAGPDGGVRLFAAELCSAYGLPDVEAELAQLDDQDRDRISVLDGDTPKEIDAITLSGALRLSLRATRPELQNFRRWVFSEVLPQVFSTGRYLPAPEVPVHQEMQALRLQVEALSGQVELLTSYLLEVCKPGGLDTAASRLSSN